MPRTDTPPRWLTAAEQEAWRTFVFTRNDLDLVLSADLAPYGLTTGDYEVLVWLSEAEESRMRMCDLAEALQLSPSGLTRRLDGMVKAGLVERASCASDRRVMWAVLTPAGWDKMRAAAPAHVAGVRRHILDPLGPEGVRQLGELFGRIRQHLDHTKDS